MSTGTGRTKSVSKPAGHRDDTQQPVQRAERLVEGGGQNSAVGETGGALVRGAHRELGGDADAVLRASRQVQPVGLFVAASETVSVVRAEELTGCGGIGVPHGRYGVGGGRQSCRSTTHRRRPYPRVLGESAPCQA